MTEIFGVPIQALMGQLMLGLVSGSFYAMLSLGLAVIFGMLNIINFAHGALYMMGAFLAWMGLEYFALGYWQALLLAPLAVGLFGIVIEQLLTEKGQKRRPAQVYRKVIPGSVAAIVEDETNEVMAEAEAVAAK